MATCSTCTNDRPDELAPAWGLPWAGLMCADCWAFHTEMQEALERGDWETFDRLAARALNIRPAA